MGILQFLADQNSKAGFADWVGNQFGSDSPITQLAQADPDTARQILPNLLLKQDAQNREEAAFRDFYGVGQPDQNGITWNKPNASALARLQAGPAEDQTQFDLSPEQIQQLSIQNALKSQSQADQARKISALALMPAAIQSQYSQNIALNGSQGEGGGQIDKIATAIANYQMPPPSSFQLKTPAGLAIQNRIMEINPDYDANVYKERTKTAQDISPGGVMGQKIGQAQTAINHLASLMEASEKMGGVNAGPASNAINYIINAANSQDPELIKYKRFQKMSADEVAKFVAGSGGSTEADRKAQEELLSATNSPEARKTAAQAAVQTMFGKLEPIADQYNKAYGTNKIPADFLSNETKLSLKKLGMLPDGVDISEEQPKQEAAKSALSQIGQKGPDPRLLEALRKRGLLNGNR